MEQTAALVEQDLPCLVCGYNLRALPVLGNCPECGSPVLRSIRGDLLRYANQDWVSRMHLGLRIVWWGIPAFFSAYLVAALLALLVLALAPLLPMRVPDIIVDFIEATVNLAPFIWPIANAWGWWWATVRDPAETQSRTAERIALRATGVLVLPAIVVWIRRDSLPLVGTWTPIVTEVVTLACFALVVYHLCLVVRFMERIHRRCAPPDAKLIELHRVVIERLQLFVKLVPSFVFALYVFQLMVIVRGHGPPPGGGGWGEGIGYILTGLLWLLVTANLLTTLRCIRAERVAAEYQDDSADFAGEGFGSAVPHSEHAAGLPDSDKS